MSPKSSDKNRRRNTLIITGLLLIPAAVFVYFSFNPENSVFFPKCPFKLATGWDCPGCGSQRAIHHLLHGDLSAAWSMNPLFMVVVPYILLGLAVELFRNRNWAEWLNKYLYGPVAGYVLLIVIVAYTILRNIL